MPSQHFPTSISHCNTCTLPSYQRLDSLPYMYMTLCVHIPLIVFQEYYFIYRERGGRGRERERERERGDIYLPYASLILCLLSSLLSAAPDKQNNPLSSSARVLFQILRRFQKLCMHTCGYTSSQLNLHYFVWMYIHGKRLVFYKSANTAENVIFFQEYTHNCM